MIDPTLPTSIKFVRQYKAKKVIYDVEMTSTADSQSIRDAYGLFWWKKSGRRLPDGLRGLSLSNVTTFSTRVRVRMLKELCHLHQAANPTVSCFVISYLARPELKIRDRKGPLTSLSYTQAITKLSHHLTLDFLKELYQYARTNLPEEEVVERFLVLGSDLLCTASTDLISMSVDEGNPAPTSSSTPPLLNSMPVSQPAATASLLPPPPQSTSTPIYPALSNPTTHSWASPGSGLVSDVVIASQNLAPVTSPQGQGHDQEGSFSLVDRRGRTRFGKRSAPYQNPS
jgi:hypothetical protein